MSMTEAELRAMGLRPPEQPEPSPEEKANAMEERMAALRARLEAALITDLPAPPTGTTVRVTPDAVMVFEGGGGAAPSGPVTVWQLGDKIPCEHGEPYTVTKLHDDGSVTAEAPPTESEARECALDKQVQVDREAYDTMTRLFREEKEKVARLSESIEKCWAVIAGRGEDQRGGHIAEAVGRVVDEKAKFEHWFTGLDSFISEAWDASCTCSTRDEIGTTLKWAGTCPACKMASFLQRDEEHRNVQL